MNYLLERRQEEKERRRGEILDAAVAVAASEGIEAMTMDQVARKARLSRALLYVYFNDKSDLLFGICSRGLDLLRERFEQAVARHPSGLEQAMACGRAYVAFAQEFPVHFDALARFEAHAPQPVATTPCNEGACVLAGDKVHAALIRAIENGVRDGSIRADVGPPPLVSVTLWGFTHGIIQLASTKANALAQNGISTSELVQHALATMARSLARTA
jgi:TetR/AcrR family transcriptional regulator